MEKKGGFSSSKNKKGSHVGVMLSFVVFVSFVVFMYVFIQPLFASELEYTNMETLRINLIENASLDLTSVSVSVGDNDYNCVGLIGFFGNNRVPKGGSENVFVFGLDGDEIHSEPDTNLKLISPDENFFKVYISEGINILNTNQYGVDWNNCELLNYPNNYTIGNLRTEKIVFESEMEKLFERYSNLAEYERMKNNFGMANVNGFGFDFLYANKTDYINSTGKWEPQFIRGAVYAGEFPVLYINKNNERRLGYLRLRIW